MSNEHPTDNHTTEIDPRKQDRKMPKSYWYDWALYILIGIVLGLFNVWLSWYMYYCTSYFGCESCLWDPNAVAGGESAVAIWAFFIVPFLFVIPALIFSNMKRTRGYAYVMGYVAGGIIGAFIWDIFIGAYTSSVATILFLIIYFIFWKIWRSVTKFKT